MFVYLLFVSRLKGVRELITSEDVSKSNSHNTTQSVPKQIIASGTNKILSTLFFKQVNDNVSAAHVIIK